MATLLVVNPEPAGLIAAHLEQDRGAEVLGDVGDFDLRLWRGGAVNVIAAIALPHESERAT
jgi:hypothetical protein